MRLGFGITAEAMERGVGVGGTTFKSTPTNHPMKKVSIALAVTAAAVLGSFSSAAKADYYTTNRFGNSTYTYGSGGQSLNTTRIGNTTFYNGRTSYGSTYSGSCTTIGITTFCN